MKEEILTNLSGIMEYIKQGADFVKEQAPLFIQEYLLFKTYLYLFLETTCLVLLFVCGWWCYKSYKNTLDPARDDEFWSMMTIVCGLVCIFAIIGFICWGEELFKVIFAPRVFLVDHLLASK